MDPTTLRTYDELGLGYAERWLQAERAGTHSLLTRFFRPAERTLDVGSGSGRDVDWLCAQGFPAEGVEASSTLLRLSRERFPDRIFHSGHLPDLALGRRFGNVLCRNVIMHLAPDDQCPALEALLAHLGPSGVLVLTWRPDTPNGQARDAEGRLYAHVDETRLREAAARSGATWQHTEDLTSGSSGRRLRAVVLRGRVPTG